MTDELLGVPEGVDVEQAITAGIAYSLHTLTECAIALHKREPAFNEFLLLEGGDGVAAGVIMRNASQLVLSCACHAYMDSIATILRAAGKSPQWLEKNPKVLQDAVIAVSQGTSMSISDVIALTAADTACQVEWHGYWKGMKNE